MTEWFDSSDPVLKKKEPERQLKAPCMLMYSQMLDENDVMKCSCQNRTGTPFRGVPVPTDTERERGQAVSCLFCYIGERVRKGVSVRRDAWSHTDRGLLQRV